MPSIDRKVRFRYTANMTRHASVSIVNALVLGFNVLGLIGCVTPQTKLNEAETVNSLAVEKGFAKTPLEAVKLGAKNCTPPATPQWNLKLTAQGPFIRQQIESGKEAYGPYQIVCFSFSESGKKKLKLSTKHQGGGYSKAYYVLPSYSLFTKDFQPVPLSQKLDFKQQAWTGDYQAEIPLDVQGKQIYYLLIESNNRHPDLSWNKYPNSGLGWALQGVFPVEVRSSPYGTVKIEILP